LEEQKKAGKSKLKLSELLSIIINNTCHEKDTVRCRYGKDSSSDGRNLREMQFDSELRALINKFKNGAEEMSQVGELYLKPTAKSLFSAEDYALATQSAIDVENFIQGFEGEERDIIAKCRINQGKFRTLLLGYWGGNCAVSRLNDERLLIASHILPWSKSTSNQKGDPFNGLLLSIVWDSLFDKGLISFDGEGNAILGRLTEEVITCLGLNAVPPVIDPKKLTIEHKQYLQMHRILHQFD
jgi:hypothetical protein